MYTNNSIYVNIYSLLYEVMNIKHGDTPDSDNIDNLLNEVRARYDHARKKASLAEQSISFAPISEAGERIRVERKKQRMTLNELCELSGVAYATLSKIERGHPGVRLDSLEGVSRALGLKLWIG